MRRARLALFAVLAVFVFQGLDCDSDDAQPAFCEVEIAGPEVVEVDQGATYTITLGTSFGSEDVTWDASGPGNVIFSDTAATGAFTTATFDAPGEYALEATAAASTDGICDETSTTLTVTVVSREEACDATVSGPLAVDVGATAEYEARLGVGWSYVRNDEAFTETWEITAGPDGGATIGSTDSDDLVLTASVTFTVPGTYTLSLTVTDSELRTRPCNQLVKSIRIVVTDPNSTMVPTGRIDLEVGDPDEGRLFIGAGSVQRARGPLALDASPYVFVFACDRGYEAIDLVTQQPVEAIRGVADEPTGTIELGIEFFVTNRPDSPFSAATFGSNGLFMLNWDPENDAWYGFGQSVERLATIFDVVAYTDGSPGGTYVTDGRGVSEVYPASEGLGWDSSDGVSAFDVTGVPQDELISAIGANQGGPALVVTRGDSVEEEPGAVWLWREGGEGFDGTKVGDVGLDPRKIRFLDGIAVVTNFGSDSITVLTWDEDGSAAITGTQDVGSGPVGADLLARSGGGVFVLTTGFGDASYSITEVDASGNVLGSLTTALPAGLIQPGHGAWLGDPDDSFVISCFGSDALWVGRAGD